MRSACGRGQIEVEQLAAGPIHPEVEGSEDRSRIVGYSARVTLEVQVDDLTRLQPIITRLVADGHGDLRARFDLTNPRAAAAQAQRVAIANARSEAENIASALGKRLGRLLLVGNSSEGYRGWTTDGGTITVTGSLNRPPLVLKPAPIEVESQIYADWSLVDR